MKYRKKPVVIEAIKLTSRCIDDEDYEFEDWAQEAFDKGIIEMYGPDGIICKIKTLEGVMNADYNDWLIKGVKGEIYPCKPDIFEATYEAIEPSEDQGEVVLGFTKENDYGEK